jgi:Ca-activated chloride channel family protein
METAALTFARPALLHFLWLLPLVVLLFWWAETRRRALIGRIVAPKLRALLAGNTSPLRRWFRMACVLGALGLLVVTMAGPRLGYDTLEVPHRGRDVIIAMDVSRSMLATDVAPNRLDRAKLLTEDLIDELSSDRVGLIAFAGSAFLQAPLTLDHGAVLAALDEMDTSVIPKGGSNLAAAIRMAEEAFGKAEGFSRALIIISDGEELDADGVTAAKQAAAAGIRIFTVGVGSSEGSEIQLESGDLVRDPTGKVVRSRLDEGRLRQIAEATGGFYTPLDEGAARRLAADGVDKLAETEFNANSSRRPIERYQWPLAAAIALLALQTLVGERRRRPVAALAAVVWVCVPPSAWATPAGVAAYEQGDYEQARKVFEERLRSEPDAPNLQMNAGTAAYRLKDYGKAAEHFSRAMLSDDPALRSAAEFNLANTLFRLGQGQEDRAKKKTDWKDAIAKYDAALKTRPDYTEAKENKEQVEKLLQQLEEEEKKEQEQKKDDKKQDQKQDQQKKDQKKDQQDQKNDQQKDQQKNQQQQGGEQKKDQQDQSQGDQQKDQQQQGGGDKKEDQQQGGGQKKDEQQGQGGEDQKEQQGGGKQNQQSADGGDQQKDQQQGGQGQQQKDQQGGNEKQDQQGGGGDRQEQQQQGQGNEEKKEQNQPGQDREQQGGKGEQGEQQGEGDQPPRDQQGQAGEQGQEEGEGGQPQPGSSRPMDGSGDQPAPVPQSSGEKKEGELRAAGAAQEGGQDQQGAAEAVAEAEAEEEGKMSATQARALLRSLQSEEEQVNLIERRNLQDVSRDW